MLCGVGVGFSFAVMPKLIVDAVRPTETGIATGMNTVVRTVGGVVGAQVGAVVLAAHHAAGTSVPTESGFVDAFWVGAAGALVAALAACFAAPRPRGARRRAGGAAAVARAPPAPGRTPGACGLVRGADRGRRPANPAPGARLGSVHREAPKGWTMSEEELERP